MAYREFTDAGGVLWRVWDTYPKREAAVRPQYAKGWLGFECETERRRFAPVPRGWESATDDELWEYLAQAILVTAHTPILYSDNTTTETSANEQIDDSVLARVRAVLREVDQTIRT